MCLEQLSQSQEQQRPSMRVSLPQYTSVLTMYSQRSKLSNPFSFLAVSMSPEPLKSSWPATITYARQFPLQVRANVLSVILSLVNAADDSTIRSLFRTSSTVNTSFKD